jgi:endonuclease/exonuclease/phosphatase family metal-dependent hydrolase
MRFSRRADHMLRLLVWAAQGLLIALFLAAWAARYVHPRDLWWPQVVALGMPVLILLLVVAAVAQAWVRQPIGVIVYLVLLLLVAPRYVTVPGRTGDEPTLRVLSFNADYTYFRPSARRPLAEVLEQHEPDIVVLQEASVAWYAEDGRVLGVMGSRALLPLLRHPELRGEAPDPTEAVTPVRLPVFASLRWTDFQLLEGWEYEEGDGGRRSTLSRSEVEWEGRSIAVYNVHLRSFGRKRPWRQAQRHLMFSPAAWRAALATYKDDFITRSEDVERLRAILASERLPFLVCGDLNSTPHHWTYAHLARGLQDTFHRAGRGWGATYHARFPIVRIDYILASPEWRIRRAHVLRGIASDHNPVLADVALRDRPGPHPARQQSRPGMMPSGDATLPSTP